jgi:hypothetical protein
MPGLNEASERTVLEVAAQMLSGGLLHADSPFVPWHQVWTGRHADELIGMFDRVLATGPKDHLMRLLRELRDMSSGSIQLAAELPIGPSCFKREEVPADDDVADPAGSPICWPVSTPRDGDRPAEHDPSQHEVVLTFRGCPQTDAGQLCRSCGPPTTHRPGHA